MSLSAIPAQLRMQVSQRDAGNCRYCRLNQWGQGAAFHVNHVIPRSKGGATELENLVLQCPHCSLHKSNTTAVVDIETGDESALFHPLRQAWSDGAASYPKADAWAKVAAPFILQLGPKQNGKPVSVSAFDD